MARRAPTPRHGLSEGLGAFGVPIYAPPRRPPATDDCRMGRPEHGLDELGERVRAEPGDEQDQRDTPPYIGRLHGPGAARGRTRTPVRREREAERKVANQEVDRPPAEQAEPGHRAQPHTGRAPRHRLCSSVQHDRRACAPTPHCVCGHRSMPSRLASRRHRPALRAPKGFRLRSPATGRSCLRTLSVAPTATAVAPGQGLFSAAASRPVSPYRPATAGAMRPPWGEPGSQHLGSAACLPPIASPPLSCHRSRARCRGRRSARCWYPGI
jgi:hypothetical protein